MSKPGRKIGSKVLNGGIMSDDGLTSEELMIGYLRLYKIYIEDKELISNLVKLQQEAFRQDNFFPFMYQLPDYVKSLNKTTNKTYTGKTKPPRVYFLKSKMNITLEEANEIYKKEIETGIKTLFRKHSKKERNLREEYIRVCIKKYNLSKEEVLKRIDLKTKNKWK